MWELICHHTEDPTRNSCGSAEPLAETVIRPESAHPAVVVLKVASLALLVGVIWLLLEDEPIISPPFAAVIPPPAPGAEQKDFPPEDGDFGRIVHPPDFTPQVGNPAKRVAWPRQPTTTIEGRRYSIVVDRTNPDEASRQVWLPGAGGHQGYAGRWGVRAARDPMVRRCGMKFPPFAEMFLLAQAKHFS